MEIPQLDVVSPAPRQIWQELLESDPTSNIYQTPEWLDSISAVGGYVDVSRLYTTPAGRQLVMPMVRRAGLPGMLRVEESLPSQWGTGGLVAARQVHPEDVAAVWGNLVAERAARVRIRPEHMNAECWSAGTSLPGIMVNPEVKSVVNLSGGFDRVWNERFRGAARTAVRKAERAGIVVESDSTGRLVPVYHDLYVNWVKRRAQERHLPPSIMLRRASRVEPLRKFQVVAQKLGSACRIWVARLDGQPIAAVIMLIHGTHANYWRGYSNKDLAGSVCANNLLQKLTMEYACEAGCLDYNMGWSGTRSLAKYKSSFGAVPLGFPVLTFERIPMMRVEDATLSLRDHIKRLSARRSEAKQRTERAT